MTAAFFQYILLICSLALKCDRDYNHPLYIAVAEINYNTSDRFATLVCKAFTDDLELALHKQYSQKESISNSSDKNKLSPEIEGYIKNHVQLKINGRPADFVFMNYETADNTVSVYFRINNIDSVQRFEVTDTIFYELYDKQIEIIYITVDGNRKSNRIENPESKVAFDF